MGHTAVAIGSLKNVEAAVPHGLHPAKSVGKLMAADPCCGGRTPAATACEDVECTFDKLGASTELLECWRQLEEQAMRPAGRGCRLRLGTEERRATLRFIYSFLELVGLSPQLAWFEAVTLLDAFLLRASGTADVGSIPAVAVALIKILKKKDTATLNMRNSNLSVHARTLAARLQQLGHDVPEVTEESVTQAECLLLDTLRWQIGLPSIQSWTEKFCARLSVLAGGLPFGPTLDWMWKRSYFCAMSLAMQEASADELCPPRQLALGLLVLGAVEAGLLPQDSVRHEKVETEAWAKLLEGLFAGRGRAWAGAPEAASQFLCLLEMATAATVDEIKDACELATTALRGAPPSTGAGALQSAGVRNVVDEKSAQ